MTNVTQLVDQSSRRARVAAEVRGLLGKKQVRVSQLAVQLGNSREYWRRRLVVTDVALSVDDLEDLASLLNVDIVDFFVGTGGPSADPTRAKSDPSD